MTLTRATVEQIRDLAGVWDETQVRVLAEDWLRQQEALQAARTTWRELAPHLPAAWDGGDLGYLVSDMDAVLAPQTEEATP